MALRGLPQAILWIDKIRNNDRRNGLVEFAARKRAGCMAGEGAKRQALGCLGRL
jgi:hypothetical protein